MEELKYLELQEVGIEEIISFSKLKDSPTITIIDDLNAGLFNYVVTYADELKLIFFIIKKIVIKNFSKKVYKSKNIK